MQPPRSLVRRPVIDSMVNKGIIHRNKAARHKSRLTKQVRALAK